MTATQSATDSATESASRPADQPEAGRCAPVRRWVQSAHAGHLSGLVWGTSPAQAVLVHDLGDSAEGWDAVATASGVDLVALDLPGHGRSSAASVIAPPHRQASALLDAVRSFAPKTRLVVASGFGAVVALHAARRRPATIAALLVVDGGPVASGVDSSAQLGELPSDHESWSTIDPAADPDGGPPVPLAVVTAGETVIDPIVRSILDRWPTTPRLVVGETDTAHDLVRAEPAAVAKAIAEFLDDLDRSARPDTTRQGASE